MRHVHAGYFELWSLMFITGCLGVRAPSSGLITMGITSPSMFSALNFPEVTVLGGISVVGSLMLQIKHMHPSSNRYVAVIDM